jgi:hypothetical protein
MDDIVIEGMDRLAALELEELFEADGQKSSIQLQSHKSSTGHAGSLDSVAAIVTDPDSIKMLLLTAWIVSNKKMALNIKIGNKQFKFDYSQNGAKEVLTFLKTLIKS